MATPVITKSWSNLPTDYSFTTFNQFGKDIFDKITLAMSGDFTLLSQGETTPTDTNYLWYNYNDQRIYRYYGNTWIARHPIPASSPIREIWTSTESALKTYDGGEDTAVSDSTGPFWEIDTTFVSRFPLGAGTLITSLADVAVGGTGGSEKVALDIKEMPYHTHLPASTVVAYDLSSVNHLKYENTDLAYSLPTITGAGGDPDNNNETVAHSNMPPYKGVHFIKRTARIYYTSTGSSSSAPTGVAGLYFGVGPPGFPGNADGALYVDTATRDVYTWADPDGDGVWTWD